MFKKAQAQCPAFAYFSVYYSFHVVSGGRMGGDDDLVVDVFFGQKPFDASRKRSHGTSSRGIRMHTEQGASLHYTRDDQGGVFCQLFPAATERELKLDQFVLLDHVGEPSELLDVSKISGHLKWLTTYMAGTSLDGAMTLRQRAGMLWLWLVKRYYREEEFRRSRLTQGVLHISRWVLTVGCSGLIAGFVIAYVLKPDHSSGAPKKEDKQASSVVDETESRPTMREKE